MPMDRVSPDDFARDGAAEINKTRDYILEYGMPDLLPIANGGTGQTTAAAARNAFGLGNTTGPLPVANGGTGANTAAAARTALGITPAAIGAAPSAHTHISLDSGGARFGYTAGQWLTDNPVGINNALVVSTAVTMPGVRNYGVSSNYASVYAEGGGRMGVTPSAERFKQDITPHTYTIDQLMLIQVVAYRLRTAVADDPDADGEVGVIAEQLIGAGLREFVIFDGDGRTQSVAYERLALVAISAMQQLVGTVTDLTRRIEHLEAAAS